MAIRTDYHLHTHHSGDSEAPMEDVICSGISLGLTDLCFTEHMDLDFPEGQGVAPDTFTLDADAYLAEFRELSPRYKDRIRLHFGVECGMQESCLKETNDFIKSYPFDVVLGSVHLLYREDPYLPSFFGDHPERSESKALLDYFETTYRMLQLDYDIDVLAHLDYLIRYCPGSDRKYPYPGSIYDDIIDAILQELVRREIALEVNTSALRKGMGNPNPPLAVIRRYKELGGKLLSVGSDAHLAKDLAARFSEAEKILKEAGFREYTIFQNRKPVFLPL